MILGCDQFNMGRPNGAVSDAYIIYEAPQRSYADANLVRPGAREPVPGSSTSLMPGPMVESCRLMLRRTVRQVITGALSAAVVRTRPPREQSPRRLCARRCRCVRQLAAPCSPAQSPSLGR